MQSASDTLDAFTAQRKLRELFRRPPKKSPFALREGGIVPVKLVPSLVAPYAEAKGWPAFGVANPATVDEVVSALEAAKLRVERLDRVKFRGKVKSGLFAIGLDAGDAPPDGGIPEGAEKTALATIFRCGCGYTTVAATATKNHGAKCEFESERIPRAKVSRVEVGTGDFDTSVYVCQNRGCKFGGMGRVWLNREAAYAHRKAHGCCIAKHAAAYKILESR